MDEHDELLEEAKELAKDMTQAKKIEKAFIYSYVANQELRAVWQELKHLRWLICSALVVLVLGIVASIVTG